MTLIENTLLNLCNKYGVDYGIVSITYFTGTNINACVGGEKIYDVVNGTRIFKGRRFDLLNMSVNKSLLNRDSEYIVRTITHEFAHIVQFVALGESANVLRAEKPSVNFTSYSENELEVQAEAFTISEIGLSNHSKIGASGMECYKASLSRFEKLLNQI